MLDERDQVIADLRARVEKLEQTVAGYQVDLTVEQISAIAANRFDQIDARLETLENRSDAIMERVTIARYVERNAVCGGRALADAILAGEHRKE